MAELEAQPNRSPATSARLGVCYYLLGRYSDAVETLAHSDGGALTHFYLGKSYLALDQVSGRADRLPIGRKGRLRSRRGRLRQGRGPALQRRSTKPRWPRSTGFRAPSSKRPSTSISAPQRLRPWAAIRPKSSRFFERAVAADGSHAGALFGLALENDRHGNDGYARDLYERAAAQFPTHVGTLLNLGMLYEDMQHYDKARQCYQRILDVFPNHGRARLFFKDADASRDMYYDEDARRRQDRLSQVLEHSGHRFRTVGPQPQLPAKDGHHDARRSDADVSEQELLASKNFGETSLVEIREMLSSKGLELGQFAGEIREEEPAYDPETLSPNEQALLDRPIADLNLSVRARKCMIRLGISTIGELVRRTGDDLLECKNFGVTSLNEVREKLTLQNLKLRGD